MEISHLIVAVLRRTALLNGDLQAAPLLRGAFPFGGNVSIVCFSPGQAVFFFFLEATAGGETKVSVGAEGSDGSVSLTWGFGRAFRLA